MEPQLKIFFYNCREVVDGKSATSSRLTSNVLCLSQTCLKLVGDVLYKSQVTSASLK
jgi:hypothetical protein